MFFNKKNLNKNENDVYLVAGLGNPGIKYAKNWHNLGFMVLDYFAKQEDVMCRKLQFRSISGSYVIEGKRVHLLFPQTYMNLSGTAIREAMSYYKIPLSNLLVIYDDIDIKFGDMRLRAKGSSGTHNGMRSICKELGSENFARLRIGMGPLPPFVPIIDYVLENIPSSKEKDLQKILQLGHETIKEWLFRGAEKAASYISNYKNQELRKKEASVDAGK